MNKCHDGMNGDYYALPGGGQRQYETLYEALVRECREETGYGIVPLKFAGLCEEICLNEGFREKYPDYSHKMYHIFLCELACETASAPTETDSMQVSSEWVDIGAIGSIGGVRLLPECLGEQLTDVLSGAAPAFLGSERIMYNHG